MASVEAGGGSSWKRSSRETSPDYRARLQIRQGMSAASRGSRAAGMVVGLRRVQVVYYLSRNGQLEHPHFMELSHLPNQHIRLKDVIDRLTVLRGKGMPSLFSWSCKRSYKNGYVWNDLSENDVIYPADGAEYILKGSELIHGGGGGSGSSSERFQAIQSSPRALPATLDGNHHYRRQYIHPEDDDEEDGDTDDEKLAGAGGHRRSIAAPPKAVGGGGRAAKTELPLDDASPPSSSSSDPTADAATAVAAGGSGRSSVLLQLISCGSLTVKDDGGGGGGGIHVRCAGGSIGGVGGGRRSGGGMQRGLASRLAGTPARASGGGAEEVRCMSENPRFGNPQAAEKEYFSGSIVEAAIAETNRSAAAVPTLKKSSSYNEERGSRLATDRGEGKTAEIDGGGGGDVGGGVRGKCIPGRRSSTSKQQEEARN